MRRPSSTGPEAVEALLRRIATEKAPQRLLVQPKVDGLPVELIYQSGRLVSAANCLDPAEAKRIFDQVGLDFYTMHPYSYEPNLMKQSLEILRGKPAVFTEWGGYLFVDNPNLKLWFKQVVCEYAQNRDPKPNLAGMSYWQFQDVFLQTPQLGENLGIQISSVRLQAQAPEQAQGQPQPQPGPPAPSRA